MKDYFFLSADINHLFFEGWHFQGTGGVIGCCVMIFVLTILLEAGKAVIFYIQLRLKQNPLTYGRTGTTSIQDTSTTSARSGVGYFVFGAVNARNRLLFTRLQTEVYTSPHNSQTGLTNASYTPPGNDANSRNSGDVTEIS
ncbi:hypothetical protein MAR_033781 [Mya arenaria]|uniref:Copper transport protein n=1 Tax=Mya arenaria TaxID=6604 RepID=A0ABY7GD27_MYAAR|nr:hypothetical protein MAR_033781 [Mya arenaria]